MQINKSTYKIFKFAATFSLAAVFFSGIIMLQPFSSDNSYASEHKDEISGDYNGTNYSLTTTVSDLNLELKTLPTGTSSTYGSQTVNVKTNAPGGYILYMSTSGDLTNSNASSDDKISSITGTNSTLDTNTWGYTSDSLLSSTSTTLNSNPNEAAEQSIWNKLPVGTDTSLTSVASTSSDTSDDGEDSTLYYGIKADSSLDDGDYTGTITYTTIASDVTSANESTNGLTVSASSGTAGTAATLTITTPLMATSSLTINDITATVGSSYTCTPTSIESSAPLSFKCTVTVPTAGTYSVTANIAKYNKTYTKTSGYTATEFAGDLSDITYMQDENVAKACKNSTTWTSGTNNQFTLTDSRDNEAYVVRKLKDGKCWMATNLRLRGENLAPGVDSVLNSTNTDLSPGVTFNLPSSAAWTGSSATYNGLIYSSNASSANPGEWSTARGTYYTWCTATADCSVVAGANVQRPNSICPKKWKLPNSNGSSTASKNQYYNLYSKYNNVDSFNKAFNYYYDASAGATVSGAYYYLPGIWWSYKGYVLMAGSYAYWWSSTSYSEANTARSLYMPTSSDGAITLYMTDPSAIKSMYDGASVRCVLSSS